MSLPDPGWLWLSAGLLLAAAEIVVPGVFLIWIGLAALLTGVLTLASGVAVTVQLALFVAGAVGSIAVAQAWVKGSPPPTGDPLLNDRAGRLVGRLVRVVEPVGPAGGRVAVEDGAWAARGPHAPEGAWVRVVGSEDGRLLVVPETPSQA